MKKVDADRAFEGSNLTRDCGLGDAQLAPGRCETPEASGRLEQRETLEPLDSVDQRPHSQGS